MKMKGSLLVPNFDESVAQGTEYLPHGGVEAQDADLHEQTGDQREGEQNQHQRKQNQPGEKERNPEAEIPDSGLTRGGARDMAKMQRRKEGDQGGESSPCFQFADGLLGIYLAALQPVEDLGAELIAGGSRVGFDKFKAAGDAVQPSLDGGITDAEDLLHFLDRAVAADEGGDEDLIFGAELGKLGKLECALDGDIFFGQPDAFDEDGLALGEPGQLLPVARGSGIALHEFHNSNKACQSVLILSIV
jgi:hypothetical protein